MLDSTLTLNFDPLIPKVDAYIPVPMHQSWKFGENTSNTFQDNVLTIFGTHGRMDARTNSPKTLPLQPHYVGGRLNICIIQKNNSERWRIYLLFLNSFTSVGCSGIFRRSSQSLSSTHTYMHTCKHTYTHTYMHTCRHISVHTVSYCQLLSHLYYKATSIVSILHGQ